MRGHLVFSAMLGILIFASGAHAQTEAETEDDAVKCTDGVDNDGDGTIDCDDEGCGFLPLCQNKEEPSAPATENTIAACKDSADNDMDGFVDCDDQDCSVFVFCSSAAAPAPAPEAPASLPVRISYGKGLFITGTILSAAGLGAMLGGAVVAWLHHDDFEDQYVGPSVGPFVSGACINMVGVGLLVGAQIRPITSLRSLGQPAGFGFLIGGSVLYGFNIIFDAVMAALGPTVGPSPAPYFTAIIGVTLVTVTINGIGWTVAARRLRMAQQAQVSLQNKGIRIMPYITPVRSGAMAGIAASF